MWLLVSLAQSSLIAQSMGGSDDKQHFCSVIAEQARLSGSDRLADSLHTSHPQEALKLLQCPKQGQCRLDWFASARRSRALHLHREALLSSSAINQDARELEHLESDAADKDSSPCTNRASGH